MLSEAQLHPPAVGVWLLFSQEPTDRALKGWNALGDLDPAMASEETWLEWLVDAVTL